METSPAASGEARPAGGIEAPSVRLLARQSARFLGIACGISLLLALAYRLAIVSGLSASPSPEEAAAAAKAGLVVAVLCMMAPLAATIACQLMDGERPLRGIGVSWKVNRWWFAAWFAVPALVAMSIAVSPLMPGSMRFSLGTEPMGLLAVQMQGLLQKLVSVDVPLTPVQALAVATAVSMVVGATANAVAGFFEEIGWRGYWLAKFRGRRFFLASTVIGALWGLWHAPLIVAMGLNYPGHPVAGCALMVVSCVAMGTIVQYFRVKSGSVLVAAIFHGTTNALAGTALIVLENFSHVFGGTVGVAGLLTNLVAVAVLFAVDRYVTGDRIMTGKLDFRV